MKKILFIMAIFSFTLSAKANECLSTNKLLNSGWIEHPSTEFESIYFLKSKELKTNSNYIPDFETIFSSPYLEHDVHFQSWDNTTTPDIEMYGDLIFYSEIIDGQVIEIRWYQGQKKHFVTRNNQCTCDDAPLAENSLF